MKLFDTLTALAKEISLIKTAGAKLDNRIHVAAVSAIAFHAEHGQSGPINDLIAAMPKGSRVNALKEFFQANSGCDYDEVTSAFQHTKGKPADLDAAMEKSWVEYKPETPYRPFDAMAAMKKLVQRVKEADAGRGDKCTKEQAESILTLAATMGVEA